MPWSPGSYSTNGIGRGITAERGAGERGACAERAGTPRDSASPQLRASPPWCTSSRITRVRAAIGQPLVDGMPSRPPARTSPRPRGICRAGPSVAVR